MFMGCLILEINIVGKGITKLSTNSNLKKRLLFMDISMRNKRTRFHGQKTSI